MSVFLPLLATTVVLTLLRALQQGQPMNQIHFSHGCEPVIKALKASLECPALRVRMGGVALIARPMRKSRLKSHS
jgi:hypothetical protein